MTKTYNDFHQPWTKVTNTVIHCFKSHRKFLHKYNNSALLVTWLWQSLEGFLHRFLKKWTQHFDAFVYTGTTNRIQLSAARKLIAGTVCWQTGGHLAVTRLRKMLLSKCSCIRRRTRSVKEWMPQRFGQRDAIRWFVFQHPGDEVEEVTMCFRFGLHVPLQKQKENDTKIIGLKRTWPRVVV